MKANDSDIPNVHITPLVGSNLNFTYGEGKYYEVTLLNNNNIGLANQNILITINGKTYTRFTICAGVAKIKINLNIGTYTITAKFEGNENYSGSNVSNIIYINNNKISTILISQNLTKNFKTSSQYIVTLKDSNNNVIANQIVKITINGKP